jgi:hypothetical protein
MTCDPTGRPCPECTVNETSYKMRIAVLEEQLRQALLKLHRIANALLGDPDVCEGTVQASGIHDGRNPVDGSELRI